MPVPPEYRFVQLVTNCQLLITGSGKILEPQDESLL